MNNQLIKYIPAVTYEELDWSLNIYKSIPVTSPPATILDCLIYCNNILARVSCLSDERFELDLHLGKGLNPEFAFFELRNVSKAFETSCIFDQSSPGWKNFKLSPFSP